MTTYEDPLWQTIVYIGLNPLYRLMHYDRYNLLSAGLGILAMLNTTYLRLLFSGFGLLILVVKHYLICGPTYEVYSEPRKYNNSTLQIVNGLPLLSLNEKSSYLNGYAYGMILAEEIAFLINRFKKIVRPNLPRLKLDEIIQAIPPFILDEMYGMLGALSYSVDSQISFEDLLYVQLAPELANIACTCYAIRSPDIIIGRNMDWLPFSSAQYSVIIYYKKDDYHSLSVPGLIGCITSWNSEYFLAMNVVGGCWDNHYNRLSSTLSNKVAMQCKTYNEVCKFAESNQPLTAYHLTIACKDQVKGFSYYQTEEFNLEKTQKTTLRSFDKSVNSFATLNWTYPANNLGRYISAYRHTYTNQRSPVAQVLKECQTFETVHSVIADFNTGEIVIGVDNGFAADSL